jgi:hypothetical protein
LEQAAQLIGQSPETLKTDAYQNMRGGAALLRQLYDQTPKPADATNPDQIESWREAIAKYTGIPQPELSQAHALRVYEFMNQGCHQYGIEWDAHPVNLGPMREDVARIKAAAHGQIAFSVASAPTPKPEPPAQVQAPVTPPIQPIIAAAPGLPAEQTDEERQKQRRLLLSLMLILAIIGAWRFMTRKR